MVEFGEPLSAREHEILCLVATGATNRMVAQELNISHNTVKVHLRNIFTKLGINSRTEATVLAIQEGWVVIKDSATGGALPVAPTDHPHSGERTAPEPEPASIVLTLPWSKRIYLFASVFLIVVITFITWPRSHPLPAETCDNEFTAGCASGGIGLEVNEPESLWVSAAAIPQPCGRFGLVSFEGLIYLIGGETTDGITTKTSVYDSGNDTWRTVSDKPNPAINITAIVLNNRFYVPGGSDANGNPLRILDIYDPLADSWFEGESMPVHLTAYAAVGWQHKMYIVGGWDGSDYSGKAWVYEPESGVWESMPPMPTPRGFAAAAIVNNKLLVIGGYDGQREFAVCEMYDPQENNWTVCASMSSPRGGLGAAVVAGQLYAIGGGWKSFVTFSERYNPNSDAWHNVETPLLLVGGEWRNMGVVTQGTRIYAMGGWQQNRYLNINQVYETLPNRLYLPAAISP